MAEELDEYWTNKYCQLCLRKDLEFILEEIEEENLRCPNCRRYFCKEHYSCQLDSHWSCRTERFERSCSDCNSESLSSLPGPLWSGEVGTSGRFRR